MARCNIYIILQVLVMYKIWFSIFRMSQLLSLLTTLRILRHWGALLALMYLDQDGNIVCNQSIYAAIRRNKDDFPLPMGDPAINTSYVGLAYDIGVNGLEQDKPYPAVRRQINIRSKWI